MANKFTGTYQELKDKVDLTGFKGDWKDLPNGQRQFKTETGICLNWWESSKTITIQGADGINKEKFEEAFFNALNNAEVACAKMPQSDFVPSIASKKIFIVHGHDEDSLKELELFIMRLGLEPYILKNNVEGGKTIIEALEQRIVYDSAFGIVLMTPDDVGCSKKDYDTNVNNICLRARQNVILEMGILIGSIGRKKVAILRKGDIENPSDVGGLLYESFKNSIIKEIGSRLIKHMQSAGIPIDPNKINQALS